MTKARTALTLLAAGALVIGLSTPASAGPSARTSARLTITSDCVATVSASWAGVTYGTDSLGVHLTGQSDGSFSSTTVPVSTVKGSVTVTFVGTPRSAGKQDTTAAVSLSASPASKSSTKSAACTGWAFTSSTLG